MNKQSRYYSLFEKVDGKWVRISTSAYLKSTAVRVYQSSLLAPFLGSTCDVKGLRSLRVVKDK